MTHGLNLNRNFVPAKLMFKGRFVRPKQVRGEPGFAVPISTRIGEMSFSDNPILAANWLEMQHPALFPESTSAEQGMLEIITGTYVQAFIDMEHT